MTKVCCQLGYADEAYVALYLCLACRSTWRGEIMWDRTRQAYAYQPSFRFCPCCGSEFAKCSTVSQKTQERHRLRAEASNRGPKLPRVRYGIESRLGDSGYWVDDGWSYGSARLASAAWRERRAAGAVFETEVRVYADDGQSRRSVLGPVRLEAGTRRDVMGFGGPWV